MSSIFALAPLAVILGTSLFILLAAAFIKKSGTALSVAPAVIALIGCALLSLHGWTHGYFFFGGSLILDDLAVMAIGLLAGAGLLIVLMGFEFVRLQGIDSGAYHALLLMAVSGLVIIVSSRDLLVIFLGLEVLSVSSYILAGLMKIDPKSAESAVKYFMTGSLAAAFLIFGLAFLYGTAGSLNIPSITAALRGTHERPWAALVGLGLVLIGIGFKIALVPFHMWTPDVFEGAPTPVAAFLSFGPKAAGFVVLLRLLIPFLNGGFRSGAVRTAIWTAAILTMAVGNLAALRQKNIKRLLAYSSIAHSGYILIAVLACDGPGLIFYLFVYLAMNIGAFSAVVALGSGREERLAMADYAGIGLRSPWIGAMLSIFLLSLAGFPPTGGFLAKFLIFRTAVERGLTSLVVVAVLASLVSVYYYLRLIVIMYMTPAPREDVSIEGQPGTYLVLFLCLLVVLQLGLNPGNILAVIRKALSF